MQSTGHPRTWIAGFPWFVVVPVLVSLGLGLWGLDTPGLWYDERVTAEATQLGPFVFPWDAAIIPYYVIEWVWTAGGRLQADAWLRGLSLLAILVAVAAASLTGRRLSGARAGMAAGLLLSLSPGVARYSQEARVYAIAVGLVGLATWFFVEAVIARRRHWWAAYAASLLAMGGVAPFALTILVVHALLLAASARWRLSWRPWALSLLALIPGLSLQVLAALRFASMHDWIPKATLEALPGGLLWPGNVALGADWTTEATAVIVVLWVVALLSAKGARWAASTAGAVAALWLVSLTFVNFWIVRSALPLVVPLAIGAGLAAAEVAWWRLLAIATLLAAVTWPLYSAPRQPGGRAEDVKVAAQIVDREGVTGDVINTETRRWLEFGVKRYAGDLSRFTFAGQSSGRTWVFSGDSRDVTCPEIQRWEIPGNGYLILCGSLAEGAVKDTSQ